MEGVSRTAWSSRSVRREDSLLPFVVRLPLLHERGHALFGVFALEQLYEQLAFELESFCEWQPGTLYGGLLDASDRERRSGRVRANALESLLEKLPRGYHFVDDAGGERVLRRHRGAAQHEVERLLPADQPRKPLGPAGTGKQAERDLRKA